MIEDRGRLDAYARAIQQTVRRGAVVLDVGAGQGIFTFLALRAGARHVYAVETNEIIEGARLVARGLGFSSQITFLRQDASGLRLPEHVDVLLADVRGTLPIFGKGLSLVNQLAERALNLNGAIVPMSDQMFFAPVEAPNEHARIGAWGVHGGIDYSPLQEIACSRMSRARFVPEQIVAEALALPRIVYGTKPLWPLSHEEDLRVERDGTVHGLAAWFDARLTDTIGFDSGPRGDAKVYKQGFFPFAVAKKVKRGAHIRVRVSVRELDGLVVWQWQWSGQDAEGLAFSENRNSLAGLFLKNGDLGSTGENDNEA